MVSRLREDAVRVLVSKEEQSDGPHEHVADVLTRSLNLLSQRVDGGHASESNHVGVFALRHLSLLLLLLCLDVEVSQLGQADGVALNIYSVEAEIKHTAAKFVLPAELY